MIATELLKKVNLGVLEAYKLEIDNKSIYFVSSKFGYSVGGAYGRGNFSFSGEDSKENVLKNLLEISTSCDINEVFTVRLDHTNKIFSIEDDTSLEESRLIISDGIYSEQKNKGIGITTADCYPVFLVGKKSLTALHCGWKSTFKGIVENGIEKVLSEGDEVQCAVIGPGICEDCYDFGLNDLENIVQKYDTENRYDISTVITDVLYDETSFDGVEKVKFNLKGLIENIFVENNVKKVYDIGVCTYETEQFYSHRKLKRKGGRFLSFGYIK